jgi:hypothetical protein
MSHAKVRPSGHEPTVVAFTTWTAWDYGNSVTLMQGSAGMVSPVDLGAHLFENADALVPRNNRKIDSVSSPIPVKVGSADCGGFDLQ